MKNLLRNFLPSLKLAIKHLKESEDAPNSILLLEASQALEWLVDIINNFDDVYEDLKHNSWTEEIEIQKLERDLEKIYILAASVSLIVGVAFGIFLSCVFGIPSFIELLGQYEISIVYLGD